MAQIGWIDFSPDHRDRVAAVLDMLKPEGVVDELGIGSIRDAFADQMFPGISTIQTRAKYFFIVPYILYDYQKLPAAKQRTLSPDKYLEEKEYQVMWNLAEQYDHKEGKGVIGISKRKPEKIMRRPSAIYWNGLRVFGLIQHGGLGVNSFLKSRGEVLDSLASEPAQGDDAPHDDVDAQYTNRFQLKLPYDRNWAETLTLDLTRSEAKLLSDRIRAAGKNFLISAMMQDKDLFAAFRKADRFADFSSTSVKQKGLNPEIEKIVVLAHDFSELMYGAHITYNCILQKKKYSSTAFSDDWNEWTKGLRKKMLDYAGFSPDAVLLYVPNLRSHTRQFVLDWWRFVNSNQSTQKRDELIEMQEFNTKRHKARIRQNKCEDVPEDDWIGLGRLEYRMRQVKTIIQDVYTGLEAPVA